jgi:hypothetical protein
MKTTYWDEVVWEYFTDDRAYAVVHDNSVMRSELSFLGQDRHFRRFMKDKSKLK